MKKLMTVLASAATALFAIGVAKGDGLTTQGTGFEDYSEGAVFDAQKNDAGGSTGDKFWYSTAAAGEIGEISNHVNAVAAALVPDYFKDDSENNRYLHIDASAPLFRTAVAHSNTFAPGEDYTFTGVDIGGGIYLDTLVQFTAADDAFQTDLDSGDKIAISYVEHEDDVTTDENEAWTNFVIRAGAIVDEEFGQANYFATVPAGFNKDDWHRLTVRTIADVGDGQVGFIIYLDGDQTKALSFTNAVVTGFTSASLNTLAKEYFDKNALYPSAVNSGTDKATISAASFSGTGALDDVVFTATKPSFIQEAAQVTITWDEGFTAVTIDGTAVTAEELAAKTKTVPLVGGKVLVTYTLASGYEEGAFSSTWDSTLGGFTGLEGGATCELKSLKANFDVGGTHYDKFADALAAAVAAGTSEAPATIKLLADYAGDIVLNTGNIIIDLAGKTLTGNKTAAIVNNAATIRIINSTVEIGHVVAPAGKPAILLGDDAMVTVEEGWIDGTIILDGDAAITAHLSLIGGKFLDEEYDPTDEEAAFYLKGCVAAGLDVTYLSNNYFQVGETPTAKVAEIVGGAQYETLAAAIEAASAGDTVKLLANITLDERVEPAKNLTIDLGGKTITRNGTSGNGSVFDFKSGTATVTNGTIVCEQDDTAIVADGVYAITVRSGANVTLDSLTITVNSECGACVYPFDGATVTILGGTYENKTTTPYRYKTAWTGMAVNQANVATQLITIRGGSFKNVDPDLGDDSWAADQGTFLDEGYESKLESGYYVVTQEQVEDEYPTYIEELPEGTDKEAYKTKYNTWKETNVADTGSAYGAAFLLNIAPDAEDQTLEPASITIADGKVVITANKNLGTVNGKVYVKTATTLAGLKTAGWVAATLDDDKAINVTPGSTDEAGFYQIKVDF